MATELSRIGTNINQLAAVANKRNVALVAQQWEDIHELQLVLPKPRTFLGLAVKEMRRQNARLRRKSEFGG